LLYELKIDQLNWSPKSIDFSTAYLPSTLGDFRSLDWHKFAVGQLLFCRVW